MSADTRRDAVSERQPLLDGHRDFDESGSETSTTPTNNAALDISLGTELKVLAEYSGPMVLTYFLQYGYQISVILVASQLSTDELAGVSLGITTAMIIGYAIFEGMATCLDTLCSQSYGSGRLSEVGLHTIRFTILVHLVAIPIGLLWLFSEQILRALVPSEEVAAHAGTFLRYALIGVPGYASFEAGKRFLQAQGNFTGGLYVLLICLPVTIGLNYALVIAADMRVSGAALAASLTNTLRPLLLAAYSLFLNRSTLKCWPSKSEIVSTWNKEWYAMLRLAASGTVINLSEWLSFEILTFSLAYLGNAPLAAQTFLTTTSNLVWHISFSISIAGSTRIGNLVGLGLTRLTMLRIMNWYFFIFLASAFVNVALALGIVLLMLQYLIHDEEVARIVTENLVWMLVFGFWDTMALWPHSIVRGIGWQNISAYVTLSVSYLYAVPLALLLELGPPHLGVSGLWIGLGSGVALVTGVESLIVWRRLRKNKEESLTDYGDDEQHSNED